MLKNLDKYLTDVETKGTTTIQNIKIVEKALEISLPLDFKLFLEKYNGAEGGIGENSYIQIWSAEDIVKRNKRLDVNEFAPGLVLIGSDGGGTAYAYDTRDGSMPIVEIPFIPMRLKEVKICAKDLAGFFEYLYNQK